MLGAAIIAKIIFKVAPCMLIVLSPLYVQLKHTNYYKIVKQLLQHVSAYINHHQGKLEGF